MKSNPLLSQEDLRTDLPPASCTQGHLALLTKYFSLGRPCFLSLQLQLYSGQVVQLEMNWGIQTKIISIVRYTHLAPIKKCKKSIFVIAKPGHMTIA